MLSQSSKEQTLALGASIANKISQQLFDIEHETFSLTTSIGGAILNENIPSVERAIERSETDVAQLREDSSQGNGARLFAPDIHSDEVSQNEAVVITAKKLLTDKMFSIRYQPIVALISGGSGKEYYEVILGINEEVPTQDVPDDFINNLFKSEIAAEVDRWVIHQAIKALSSKLSTSPDTQLFINISPQSFADTEFLPWLTEALRQSKLPANVFIFQFRENDAVRHLHQAAAISEQMKEVDGRIGIANFGLAINPLQTLERVSVDFVKIDPAIVEKLQSSPEGKKEFQDLMGGMTGTGVDVIVPFVEKANVLPLLWQQGVQYIQGHYVNRPSFEMDYDFSESS